VDYKEDPGHWVCWDEDKPPIPTDDELQVLQVALTLLGATWRLEPTYRYQDGADDYKAYTVRVTYQGKTKTYYPTEWRRAFVYLMRDIETGRF